MLAPDQHLGPYRLVARVGAGGMGEVWRAEDSRLGRTVAIKVLPPSFVADVEATARLKREARTAAQLYHPSIATIHSIEQDGDHIFIVEEFVEGESLTNVIRRGGLSEAEICRICRAVADALAEAHAKGIVHRDIKPDNIIVAGNRVKVLDFGIAKQVGVAGASASDTPTAAFVTQQGMIVGTIHYMSPEQALGKAIDGRTDVFSLGVVLYEMATGRRPFGGETITETMTQIIRDEPAEPLLVNPKITPGMNEIIQRSLRKNVAERYTAAELVTALDAQMGRAATAPYTSEAALTAAVTAAAPTINTGSQAKTVMEAPARPRRGGMANLAYVALIVVVAAIAVAYWLSHRGEPATNIAASAPTTPASQPASTTSVAVTAPTATLVEGTTTASPSPAENSTTATPAGHMVPPTASQAPAASTMALSGALAPATPPPAAPPPVTPAPQPAPPAQSSADTLYTTAMSQLLSGDKGEARKSLLQVVQQDPHYAKAHFQLGEIALFNRNFNYAAQELDRAMEDSDRLNPHQQQIAGLSLAIARHDRSEIERLDAEISQRWPDDVDLARMRAFFPGMFNELPRGGGGRRRRP
ncbi:MAG TPA: protein kinase [Thermoanaerobaculia bacterium]|nr:protein kinase [Thermoanaerobaculia bacterium]